MKLLVMVVTYNGMKWLDKCLSSVENSSLKADFFIVDNGSSDGTIEYIQKNYPEAHFIVSEQNLGFGKANNLGLRYAIDNNYDYVYLLNQDAWVEHDTFEKLISISKKSHEYGILSPLQTNKEKDKLDKIFAQFCPSDLVSDSILGNNLSKIYETSFVMAAHWLIPVSCIKLIGGFSPTFYHYAEDDNYIHRVLYHGKKVGIVPTCIGVHDRENREISEGKRIYLFYCHGLRLLSNPNVNNRFISLCKNYIKTLIVEKKIIYIKYLFRTLKDYKYICYNRKRSLSLGAFLNEKNEEFE